MSALPEGWVETSLGEVSSSKQYGYTESASTEKIGPKFLRITDIQHDFIDWDAVPYCPISGKNKLKYKLGIGDVVIARTGNSTGATATIKDASVDAVFASYLIRFKIDPQIADYNFIDFSLRSKRWSGFVKSVKGGSAQGGANAKNFAEYPINLPPLPEQKAIADMLSSFDEKIELLREQNKTLETLAQTIFKEWFVHFNYPDATGEMVDSELGEIPKGWRVYSLSELVNTVNGYSYKGKELVESSDEALVTLKSFNRSGGFQTRGFKPFSGTPKPQQEVMIGDLVVAHTDLTQDAEVLGNPAFVFEDGGFNKMFITMDLVKVKSKVEHIDNAFLYYVMKDRRFKGHCIGYSNGTTVLHLSKKAIPDYTIALPENLELAKEFSDMAYSMTRKISNNIKQTQALSKTRDTLLPTLMSGQQRVEV